MTTSLGDAREAFIFEHEYCGELEGAVEADRVWMTCTCGAVISLLVFRQPPLWRRRTDLEDHFAR